MCLDVYLMDILTKVSALFLTFSTTRGRCAPKSKISIFSIKNRPFGCYCKWKDYLSSHSVTTNHVSCNVICRRRILRIKKPKTSCQNYLQIARVPQKLRASNFNHKKKEDIHCLYVYIVFPVFHLYAIKLP